ncbi:MAG: peptidoglycan-binding protein [Clostridia bacterium]|nr:peptidoglycan-binding protein [Clostridia bacterium]
MATEPFIPEFITVHLGLPSQNARNVTVPFIDYIKNVASSEIYPTWPESALRANIYAQISFALNKIYTEFYRSRGYDFDITSTTQYDQAFVPGRNIFGDISRVVDDIFDSYLRRQGFLEPLAARFCNGTTVTCEGLSQWGTVSLANQGLLPYQIIQNYYGNDVNIITDVPVAPNLESYPGTPIRRGDTGSVVRRIQNTLNGIAKNYPLIPKLIPDGVFGEATEEAVETFQRIFNLIPDGVVGRATWYKLVSLFVGINRLNELNSVGDTLFGLSLEYPDAVTEGDTGEKVSILQLMLNILSAYYDDIPAVPQTGSFGQETLQGVLSFQKAFNLPQNGEGDDRTWEAMYNAVKGIYIAEEKTQALPPVEVLPYPGMLLSSGARGSDIRMLQEYINEISLVYTTVTPVTPTGNFGANTRAAVLALQKEFALPETGVVDRDTWNAITNAFVQIRQGALPAFGQFQGYTMTEGQTDSVRGIETKEENLVGRPVYSAQQMLRIVNSEKPLPGIPDGIYGKQTTSRVRTFQQENSLPETGDIDSETFRVLRDRYDEKTRKKSNPTPSASHGRTYDQPETEEDILRMTQTMLKKLSETYRNIPSLSVTGQFDTETDDAVRAFQDIFRLPQNGLDRNTWEYITRIYNELKA